MCFFILIYIYICITICDYVDIYIYTYVNHNYINIDNHSIINIDINNMYSNKTSDGPTPDTGAYRYVYMYTSIYLSLYIYIYIYIHIYIYIYIYICIRESRMLAPARPRMQAAGVQCLKLQIAVAFPNPQTRTFPGTQLSMRPYLVSSVSQVIPLKCTHVCTPLRPRWLCRSAHKLQAVVGVPS